MKNLVLFLSTLLLVLSCGKKAGTSQTKISIMGGAMLGSGPQMNGGIIVVGHRLDDSENFHIGLLNASDEKVIDLVKGQWEFAAIGWEGGPNGVFTGANRCAYSGIINLYSNDTAITFNLDYATCANIPGHGAIVSHPDYMAAVGVLANQFKPVIVQSCSTLVMPVTGVASCTGIGLTGSVKIIAAGGKKTAGSMSPLPSLETSCIPISSTGIASTVIGLPVGNIVNGKKENLIDTMVLAFQSADCSGVPISYRFSDSMYAGINQPNMKAQANSAPGLVNTTLFLEHNATTVSSNLGYSPFGYGKNGDWILATTPFTQSSTDYGKIIAIDPLLPKVTISGTSSIAAGDEIMWYVNSESTAGICGGGFVPGMFGFAQVTGITPVSVNTDITLDHSLLTYMLDGAPPTAVQLAVPTAANLAAISTCSMQLVRVPHYRNIITSIASPVVNVFAFSPTGGFGGLFPFKVSNEMNISSPLTISANATGLNVPTSSACVAGSGKRCLRMGGGTGTLGGGIILAWINRVNFSNAAGSLMITSNGGMGTSGGDGGFINTNISTILYSAVGAVPSITETVSGGTGAPMGMAGVTYFKYCSNPNFVMLPTTNMQGCNF